MATSIDIGGDIRWFIISRLSDIFGCEATNAACFMIFIAFSIGCALSQTTTQLIVFRAMQGIDAWGMYAVCLVSCMSTIPPQERSMISAYLGVSIVCSGVPGAVLGGAITLHRNSFTWPWIFWINLPTAGIALAVFLMAWPYNEDTNNPTKAAFAKIDFLGSLLLLAASALFVFSLQEAGAYTYAWSSITIVTCLVFSGVCLVRFSAGKYGSMSIRRCLQKSSSPCTA